MQKGLAKNKFNIFMGDSVSADAYMDIYYYGNIKQFPDASRQFTDVCGSRHVRLLLSSEVVSGKSSEKILY